MRYTKIVIIFLFFAGFLASCDADPCKSGDNIILKIGFYTYKKGKMVDSLLNRLTMVGLDCIDDTSCNFCINKSQVKQIGIPISSVNDSTRFDFWIDTIAEEFIDTSEVIHIDSINYYVHKPVRDTILIIQDTLVMVTWLDSVAYGHNTDNFIVFYDRIERMESPDCGVYIDFNLKSVTYTSKNFDTLIIMQPLINDQGFENIIIIF